MEKEAGFVSSRRSFLKASGLALLGTAAAAGAFAAPRSAFADDEAAAGASEHGLTDFSSDVYSEVFPVDVRYIPVVDAPTDMDRHGESAFEMREIGEDEIVRTEDCDVLVAGAGLSGSCAALSASDDGTTQVICLEKMSTGRGMFEDMGVTGGAAMTAGNYVCDHAEIMDRMRHAAYYRVPIDPIKLWADRSPEAADWLQERLNEGEGEITTYFTEGSPNAHNFEVPQTAVHF